MRENQEVSGIEMLEARDRRAAYQQLLLSGGTCIISFTMNIPGKIKTSRLISYCFQEGVHLIDKQLQRGHAAVLQREIFERKTGDEGFWLLDADPYEVKSRMLQIETSCEIGRLFDIDVILPGMKRISRTDMGYSQRSCLICAGPAHECCRSQAHSKSRLVDETRRIMKAFFMNKRTNLKGK